LRKTPYGIRIRIEIIANDYEWFGVHHRRCSRSTIRRLRSDRGSPNFTYATNNCNPAWNLFTRSFMLLRTGKFNAAAIRHSSSPMERRRSTYRVLEQHIVSRF
jgi:hypothetical protein